MDTLSDVPAANDRLAERVRHRPHGISIYCYENDVPAFAAAEIERLHGHLYCLPSYLAMTKQLDGASTYVVRRDGVPVTVLLYRRHAREVSVISEFVRLGEDDIRRFADYMFDTFGDVHVVSFGRVRAGIARLPYPWHAVSLTEDMIVPLPATVQEYDARVGKNMRRNIKRYTSAIMRDHPSYSYRVCIGAQVSEQDIRDIVMLGCKRMESKNIVPRYSEEETRWIVDLARRCGLVGIARVDGKVCAGAIGFRIGDNYFMHVIAHDPAYNDYSLGIVCYYHTICEGIARGGKLFHLLQGRYGYKYRLLAERHDVRHVDIYRSPLHALLHGRRMFGKAIGGHILAAKQWLLHDVERADTPALRRVARVVNALRQWKRSLRHGEKADDAPHS